MSKLSGRGAPADELPGLILRGDVETGSGPGGELLVRFALLPVEEVTCGDAIAVAVDGGPDNHELFWREVCMDLTRRWSGTSGSNAG